MTFAEFIDMLIKTILAPIIPILVAIALLIFLWGVGQLVLSAGNPEKSASGRKFMIWGIVALFVMTSLWGLVKFVQDTFRPVIPNTTDVVNIDSLRRNF